LAQAQFVEIPYEPRPLQLEIHDALETSRFAVAVCHRRFGKTVMAINHLLKAALTCGKERPRYAYVGPTYRQAKAVAWDYLKHYAGVVPGVGFNESELRCDLPNGAQVRLYGADNPDALRGIYLDGVVLDEVGMMQARVWTEVLRPALSDRLGWALFIGTPNGKNMFWELADKARASDGWKLFEFRASRTGIIDPKELADAKSSMTEDEFAQEFECSFEASVRGAIFAKELSWLRENNRIAPIVEEPLLPVHTAWDLGIGDSMAIWFAQQERSGAIRVIDHYENSGEALGHYVNVLRSRPYTYGRHFVPHDAQVRELGSGKSRIEMLAQLGLRAELAPNIRLEDGVNAARLFLRKCWFDSVRCAKGVDALQNYRWDYNTRLDEHKSVPVHDWASHSADAFRYLAVSMKDERLKKWGSIDYQAIDRSVV
jgi:phage terminase large subunit